MLSSFNCHHAAYLYISYIYGINKWILKRYFAEIAFDGTNYHGWQIQPNGITVQEVVNSKLSVLLKEEIKTTGAGRTDAGVHANQFYFHFDTSNELPSNNIRFIYKLNQLVPDDIVIKRIVQVPLKLHSRFDAKWRTYQYFISLNKNPFLKNYCWQYYHKLDLKIMNTCSSMLSKHNDFTSFSKLHSNAKTNLCNVLYSGWTVKDKEQLLIFEIKADRFLRNMVRAIVGTIIEAGRKRITIDEFEQIIHKKERSEAGMSVPAKGLFLDTIEYEHKALTHN